MPERTTNWNEVALFMLIAVLAFVLWDTVFVYPLKILVVFFHEMSHGAMALLTGGSIEEIRVVPQGGGLCVTRGGSAFLIASAGYLGSLVWGAAILVSASRTRREKGIAIFLGVVLILVTCVWVRPFISFGFSFGLATGALLIFIGQKASRPVNLVVLKVMGVSNCLYAVQDLVSDILARPGVVSDATILADLTGVPVLIWGGIWALAALVIGTKALLYACSKPVSSNRVH